MKLLLICASETLNCWDKLLRVKVRSDSANRQALTCSARVTCAAVQPWGVCPSSGDRVLRNRRSSRSFTFKYPLRMSSGTAYNSENTCFTRREDRAVKTVLPGHSFSIRVAGRTSTSLRIQERHSGAAAGSMVTVIPW